MEENQGNEGGGAVFQWNLGLFFQWNFRAAPAGVGSTPVTRAPRNPSGHRNHPRPGISPHGSQSKAELKNSIRICKKFRKKKKKNPAEQRNPPSPAPSLSSKSGCGRRQKKKKKSGIFPKYPRDHPGQERPWVGSTLSPLWMLLALQEEEEIRDGGMAKRFPSPRVFLHRTRSLRRWE